PPGRPRSPARVPEREAHLRRRAGARRDRPAKAHRPLCGQDRRAGHSQRIRNHGDLMEAAKVPTHVAMIMDGNGRWATSRGLPRLAGHRAGVENLRRIITACVEFGVKHLTIYAFSTENWGRPREEVDGLLFILNEVLDKELDELNRQGVQLRHIGRLEGLTPGTQKKVRNAMKRTGSNDRLILNVAFNY